MYLLGMEYCAFSCYGMLYAPLPVKAAEIFVSARRALMKA